MRKNVNTSSNKVDKMLKKKLYVCGVDRGESNQ